MRGRRTGGRSWGQARFTVTEEAPSWRDKGPICISDVRPGCLSAVDQVRRGVGEHGEGADRGAHQPGAGRALPGQVPPTPGRLQPGQSVGQPAHHPDGRLGSLRQCLRHEQVLPGRRPHLGPQPRALPGVQPEPLPVPGPFPVEQHDERQEPPPGPVSGEERH